jgi:hypothetical protein
VCLFERAVWELYTGQAAFRKLHVGQFPNFTPCLSPSSLYAVWELYTGQAAFRKLHVGQFFEAIVVRNLRPMIPRGMAADYQLLMQSCWSASPTDRCVCWGGG